MTFERIGPYEVDICGYRTVDQQSWAPYISIFQYSAEPHGTRCVFPRQRVSDASFSTEEQAVREARRVAEIKIFNNKL